MAQDIFYTKAFVIKSLSILHNALILEKQELCRQYLGHSQKVLYKSGYSIKTQRKLMSNFLPADFADRRLNVAKLLCQQDNRTWTGLELAERDAYVDAADLAVKAAVRGLAEVRGQAGT